MAEDSATMYRNEFLDGRGPDGQLFEDRPMLSNLRQNVIWADEAKFFFLPYLVHCHRFTQQHRIPHFTLMCSPTFLFHRCGLSRRCFPDTIWSAFFRAMDMCGLLDETIFLLVEKRFTVRQPIDGGTQQLYSMLWDVDLGPKAKKCLIPDPTLANSTWFDPNRGFDPNPDVKESEFVLTRRTLWLQDDLSNLGRKYAVVGQQVYTERLDLSKIPEDRRPNHDHPRDFCLLELEPIPQQADSSGSELDSSTAESAIGGFDLDSTQSGQLDSTLDLE